MPVSQVVVSLTETVTANGNRWSVCCVSTLGCLCVCSDAGLEPRAVRMLSISLLLSRTYPSVTQHLFTSFMCGVGKMAQLRILALQSMRT